MAKKRRNNYKKYKSRQDQSLNIFLIIGVIIAFLISIIVAAAIGNKGFNVGTFFITLIIVLPIMLIARFVLSLPVVRGKIGEHRVSKRLDNLAKKYGGHVIDDVIIPGENNKTSQIDHIYISRYGLFVIETKNYSGRIYGSENDQEWTQVLAYGHSKHKLYNPVKQNATHIYRLKEMLDQKVEMVSVVVFVNGNITYINSSYVYTLKELKHLITKESSKILDESNVENLYSQVMEYKNNPVVSNKEHVKEIKQMKKDIDNNICPRCGGKLVLRTSKKDGHQFLGCENYPKCSFVKK